ncbi:hypothetical protein CR983_02015 [Candidatus Saccharibacteria bacterium]|nr:MAG: hypothetical protein CR983_02015 [Candidatus Saccharibacteria bacterium]
MQFAYMLALGLGLLCMAAIDRRFQLALWCNVRRTLLTLAATVAVFVLWDAIGIWRGVFYSGQSPYMSGWYIGPEFPAEELLFLTFLGYFALIVYRLGVEKWPRTR